MLKVKDEGGMMNASREFFCGEDSTGETVRVVEEKEVRLYGEYRRSSLVSEACDARGMGKIGAK